MKKYDRRSITSAENGRRAWGKNLETQMVALADSTRDERLRFDILKYLYDRHAGKPYIATNPAERKGRTMVLDNRLQVAIKELILSPSNKPVQPAPPELPEDMPEPNPEH
jgi:hypothetical protein